jgi:hypothetical protein
MDVRQGCRPGGPWRCGRAAGRDHFLPAILLILGRAVFWPRIPRHGQEDREASRAWSAMRGWVSRRLVWGTTVSIVPLGAACAGLASVYSNGDPMANVTRNVPAVVGEQLIKSGFRLSDYVGFLSLGADSASRSRMPGWRRSWEASRVAWR